MLSYKESLKILKETDALLEGHFLLSSGLHSSKYVQCAKLLSKPFMSSLFCSSLAEKIKKEFINIDLILAPALGGIVIGYEIGRLLKLESIFSERVEKKFVLRRGFNIPRGAKVLIVEDVITTGKSSLENVELIEKANAELIGYACLIDRSNGDSMIKQKIVSQIELTIPTYTTQNLPENLATLKAIKPGSRDI